MKHIILPIGRIKNFFFGTSVVNGACTRLRLNYENPYRTIRLYIVHCFSGSEQRCQNECILCVKYWKTEMLGRKMPVNLNERKALLLFGKQLTLEEMYHIADVVIYNSHTRKKS